MQNLFIGIFYILLLLNLYLKYLKVEENIKSFFDLKKKFYIFCFFLDDYKMFDDNFDFLSDNYLYNYNYINCYNYTLLNNYNLLLKANANLFYEIEIKNKKYAERIIDKNKHINIDAYKWNKQDLNPHFFYFCILEMVLLLVTFTSFNIHYFSYFRKKEIYETKVLAFSQFFLKLDILLYLYNLDYLTFLKRIRYQEYIRMHPFFVYNPKMRASFMHVKYIVKSKWALNVKKEMQWVRYFLDNKIYKNFRIHTNFKAYNKFYFSFDLNVINLIKNTSIVKFQKILNSIDNRWHLSLKQWLFFNLEEGYHSYNGYKIMMSVTYSHLFYLKFLKYVKLDNFIETMLFTYNSKLIYRTVNALEKEVTFVKQLYDKNIVPYYLYLDLFNYSKMNYFNKKINFTSFFYAMCYNLIFKIKNKLNEELVKRLEFKDAMSEHLSYMITVDVFQIFDFFFDLNFVTFHTPLGVKSTLWNLIVFKEVIYNSKFKYLNNIYNSIFYYNWKAHHTTYSRFTYFNYSLTYNIFKSSFDFIYFNRFQQCFRSWRLSVGSYKQNWIRVKRKFIPANVREPWDTDDTMVIKDKKRQRRLNAWTGVCYFDQILNLELFKCWYFQCIYESVDLDILFFFLIEKKIIKNIKKLEFKDWNKLKKVLSALQYSIYLKKTTYYGFSNITKEEMEKWIVDGCLYDNVVKKKWLLKYNI